MVKITFSYLNGIPEDKEFKMLRYELDLEYRSGALITPYTPDENGDD